MDKLNHECLEHIFGFLNCGPKEWLLLSKVCIKWQDVVSRFWKRINLIEVDDSCYTYDPERQDLSTKQVMEMMEYAAQHVNQINITKHNEISHIKLGSHTYNLRGLNMNAVLKSLAKYSTGQILKANALPNQELLKYLMKMNQNLTELTLTLNKDCFADSKTASKNYYLRSKKNKKEEEVEKETEKRRLQHRNMCAKLCRQILETFRKLERLTVTFLSVDEQNLDMFDELLSLLYGRRDGPQELRVQIHRCDKCVSTVLSLLSQHCFKERLVTEDDDWSQRGVDVTISLRKVISPVLEPTLLQDPSQIFFKITSVFIKTERTNSLNIRLICKFLKKIAPTIQKLKISVISDNEIEKLEELRQQLLQNFRNQTFLFIRF